MTKRFFSFSRISIGVRLVVTAVLASVIIFVGAAFVLSEIYRRAAERAFDERLQVYIQSVAANIASKNTANAFDPYGLGDPRFTLPLSGWYWQIRIEGSAPQNIFSSLSLFGGRLPRLEDLHVPAHDGSSREGYIIGPDERRLRLVERALELPDGARYLVQIAGNSDEIEQTIQNFKTTLWTAFALLACVLGVTTIFQVRFGLLPLSRLSNEISAIRRGLSDRVEGQFSDDISPVADEINLLIESNRDILERARTQVGNLAHALKTPLSVILNEAAGQATPLADKVREQADIMRDQVNWHLERARAAARAGAIGVATDVEPALAGLQRTFQKIYSEKHLAIELNCALDLKFRGEKRDFEDMVGNLIDNAAKWARQRIEVDVLNLPEIDGRTFLEVVVSDDGPGLPAEKRTDVIRRGQRLDETVQGSGLGLAIVADLAGLYGGFLTLEDSDSGGLRAVLRLPSL
jgi:signal transduction histidine kinase